MSGLEIGAAVFGLVVGTIDIIHKSIDIYDEQPLANQPSDIYAAPGSTQIYQDTSTFDFTADNHGNLADKRNSKWQRSYVPNPFEPAVAQS
jgi:hypothetical protein